MLAISVGMVNIRVMDVRNFITIFKLLDIIDEKASIISLKMLL